MRNYFFFIESYLHNLLFSPLIVDATSSFDLALTSHSSRISRSFSAIESACSGPIRPRRVILFISNDDWSKPLPPTLKRLVSRGLEIVRSENMGPHTKLQPYLSIHDDFTHPLVTIDDDVFYAKDMLTQLVSAWKMNPGIIHCSRARKVVLRGRGFAPYASWPLCDHDKPSYTNFLTGVGGVIYPPEFLYSLKAAGDGYKKECPLADDIWINKQALRAGFEVCQTRSIPAKLLDVPGARRTARFKTNLRRGGNDVQLSQTYSSRELGSIELLIALEKGVSLAQKTCTAETIMANCTINDATRDISKMS